MWSGRVAGCGLVVELFHVRWNGSGAGPHVDLGVPLDVKELQEVGVVDVARAVVLPVLPEDAFGLVAVLVAVGCLVDVYVLGVEVGVEPRLRSVVLVSLGVLGVGGRGLSFDRADGGVEAALLVVLAAVEWARGIVDVELVMGFSVSQKWQLAISGGVVSVAVVVMMVWPGSLPVWGNGERSVLPMGEG